MYEHIFKVIQQFVPLAPTDQVLLKDSFQPVGFEKDQQLSTLGSVANYLYFLHSGCVRLYYLKEGKEITGYLFTEHMFLGSLESFLSQQPSTQILQAIEPCACLQISYADLQKLYEVFPKMNEIMRKLLEQRFINAQKMVASFVLDNPEERYLNLLQSNPGLLQRFPQHMLATYLGITPVSLSRIRQRIANEH